MQVIIASSSKAKLDAATAEVGQGAVGIVTDATDEISVSSSRRFGPALPAYSTVSFECHLCGCRSRICSNRQEAWITSCRLPGGLSISLF